MSYPRSNISHFLATPLDGGSPRHLNNFSNLFTVAVHSTHINTCYILLLLLYTTHISIHAMYCYYCCTLHIYQYMLCTVAIAVHYTYINTCYVLLLLLYTTHISIHAMYCCYCCTLHIYQYMLCTVAIVDCTYLEPPFGNIVQENTTADILVEEQLRPPLDMATVDQE